MHYGVKDELLNPGAMGGDDRCLSDLDFVRAHIWADVIDCMDALRGSSEYY
jgi:hypothetical protein